MNGALDITYPALAVVFLLLIFPVVLSLVFRLKLIKQIAVSIVRMTAQLLLVGLFLKYIFDLNNALLNAGWFVVMIVTATGTVIRKSDLKVATLIWPALASFLLVAGGILLFFNAFVVRVDYLFDAKYFIALGGMLLGNSLRGNIVGLTTFYKGIRRNEARYHFALASGARHIEAVIPYIRESLKQAFAPIMATMATTGIVSLPGMMTGQIIGGSSPMTAVKYQIAIMVAIFTAITMSTALTIFLTLKLAFTERGTLKGEIFRGG